MRILLVEDDAMIGEAISQALKDASYAVDWVRDGQSALSTLHRQHYDAMLLDLGADDYILKPFEMAELLARIRVTVRRNAGIAAPTLSNGILSLDLANREVTIDGVATQLSAREFSLLQALLIRPGAILSRVELEDRIYGWNEEVESNAVEFLIHSLRKKLGSSTIKNVRGVGWLVSKGE